MQEDLKALFWPNYERFLLQIWEDGCQHLLQTKPLQDTENTESWNMLHDYNGRTVCCWLTKKNGFTRVMSH